VFGSKWKQEYVEASEQLAQHQLLIGAIDRNIARIDFTPDGYILNANALFLTVMGYEHSEVAAKHHRIFCETSLVNSTDYTRFWKALASGQAQHGRFKRVRKNGEVVWLEASYFPVSNGNGQVESVTKIALDVTDDVDELDSKTAVFSAINKSMAVIEFTPEGDVMTANANFLSTLGYTLDEVKGQSHELFCEDSFYDENPSFWQQLKRGEYKTGRFKRLNKFGDTVWLEASYNPIYDANGQVIKVIKFASDITDRVVKAQETAKAAEVAYATSQQTATIVKDGQRSIDVAVSTSNDITIKSHQTDEIIDKLEEQARNIEDIVKTINGLAEQTNLLALNAAIEAARAGEHGRGFAVVADEVRNLATRTTQATGEISGVMQRSADVSEEISSSIEDIQRMAEQGKTQIEKVKAVMQEIDDGATNVVNAVSHLSS
jgi:methyl-accepting chemotaxis protein